MISTYSVDNNYYLFRFRNVVGKYVVYRGTAHSPSVLVPGLDLRVGQVELGRQLHAVLHTQVLLPLEALLQRLQLVVGEGRAGFALLLVT